VMSIILYERARLDLCYDSLAGLSVGDALGAQFFTVGPSKADLAAGNPPPGVWEWTDDTEMACSVVAELRDHGEVEPDRLAAAFAERCEPYRGYGVGAFIILHQVRQGMPWREAASAAFGGQGSCGNGAAMRVAPLGAYFAGEPARAATQAARSAQVTHVHPEGIAGAAAVAVAAAHAAAARLAGTRPGRTAYLDQVLAHVPESAVRRRIQRAKSLLGRSVAEAAYELGNGAAVTAQDTVAFTLWVAARYLDDYPSAIKACVEAGGDVDTTAAIAGGIVAAYTGVGGRGVPESWLDHREALPDWCLRNPDG